MQNFTLSFKKHISIYIAKTPTLSNKNPLWRRAGSNCPNWPNWKLEYDIGGAGVWGLAVFRFHDGVTFADFGRIVVVVVVVIWVGSSLATFFLVNGKGVVTGILKKSEILKFDSQLFFAKT